MRWSAHLGYLYTDLPMAARINAAARDGFTAIEHPAPFDMPATEMRRRLDDLGLRFSQITSGMGQAGEKGLASLAGRESEFREGVLRAIEYGQTVGCPYIHPMAGVSEGGLNDVYFENIERTVDLAKAGGMRVLIEAITIPDYAMGTLDKAIALQDRFPDDVDLLFDTFHAKVLNVDGLEWVSEHVHRIGHVHIADHPGRHEPGSGNLKFAPILKVLVKGQYQGALGFEYIPSREMSETTRFLDAWKQLVNLYGEET